MSKPQHSTVLFDALGPRGRAKARNASIASLIVFAALAVVAVIQLSGKGFFESSRWVNPLDALVVTNTWLPALGNTLKAAVLGAVGALVLGTVVGMGRVSRFRPIRFLSGVYVQFFRAMPLLLLIWIPFTLDGQAHLTMDSWGFSADGRRLFFLVLGLSIYNGAVLAEILRSGINALPPGQAMAGHAIGLQHGQVMRIIVLPQAIRNMLPAVLAQLVILLKDTALGYVITYPELLHEAQGIGRDYGNSFLQSLLIAAFVYFVLAGLLSQLVRWVERRTSRKVAKGAKPVTTTQTEPTPA